jgi:hypothetical protein
MTTAPRTTAPLGGTVELDGLSRYAAQAAAGLTVAGAVSLGVFFAIGEPWGTINDWLSIGLAGATVPIAIGLASRQPHRAPLILGAALDVAGVAVSTAFTSMLIARRMTFEESLSGVLGGQALIGCWLILVGVAARSEPRTRRTAAFAVAGGAGLVATAVGIATGGMSSPVGLAGFVAGLIGTVGFYALLGRRGAYVSRKFRDAVRV